MVFTPIQKILNELNIKFELILTNNELNKVVQNKLEEYYNIKLDIINNLKELEEDIVKLVNSHAIMFHHFHNDNFKKYVQGSITDSQLEDIILEIGRDNILDGDIWLEKYNNGELKKGECCITLDDGLKCQYEIALPVLKKFNIKAIWFIYTMPLAGQIVFLESYKFLVGNNYDNYDIFYNDFFSECKKHTYFARECNNFNETNKYLCHISFFSFNDRKFRYLRDKVLSNDVFQQIVLKIMTDKCYDIHNLEKLWISKSELSDLNKTQLIGIHSHTHPTNMEEKSYNEQYNEYKESKEILENVITDKINILSYPCGKFNDDTVNIMKKLDIKYSFISYLQIFNNNTNYFIQRVDHNKFNLKN